MELREHTEDRQYRERSEIYERMKLVLLQYGQDDIDDGDYYLVDQEFGPYMHQVEFHKLHMLRPEIVIALQSVLSGYPDWEIAISLRIPERGIVIDPNEGLTLH